MEQNGKRRGVRGRQTTASAALAIVALVAAVVWYAPAAQAQANACNLTASLTIPLSPAAETDIKVQVYDASGTLIHDQDYFARIESVTIKITNCQYDWYWIQIYDFALKQWVYGHWLGFVDASMDFAPLANPVAVAVQTNTPFGSSVEQFLRMSSFSPAMTGAAWLGLWDETLGSWVEETDVPAPVTMIDTAVFTPESTHWYWCGTWDYALSDWNTGFWMGYF